MTKRTAFVPILAGLTLSLLTTSLPASAADSTSGPGKPPPQQQQTTPPPAPTAHAPAKLSPMARDVCDKHPNLKQCS